MALSDDEKERVRYHMGYHGIEFKTSLTLGTPSVTQSLFILESALGDLQPVAEKSVRRAVQELDCLEDLMSKATATVEVKSTGGASAGGVRFRDGYETWDILDGQYARWLTKLGDTLGSPLAPFGQHNNVYLGLGAASVIEPF